MLVEVKRKELAKALRTAAKSAGKKSGELLLTGVKLSADGDCLTVTTTNLESWTVTKVASEVAESGEFLVNSTALKKIIDKVKCETVILGGHYQIPPPEPQTDEIPNPASIYDNKGRGRKTEEYISWEKKWNPVLEAWQEECARLKKEGTLTIEADGSTTLPPMQLEEYPTMPEMSSVGIATLTGKALKEAVDRAAKMAKKIDPLGKPALAGINLVLDHPCHRLVLVATDGYRLIKETMEVYTLTQSEDVSSILIPAKAWNSLAKSIGAKEEVTLGYDKEQGFFTMSVGETTFLLRKINEDFPDFERVIPSGDSPYRLTLDRADFLAAVERGEIVASEETGAITLQAKGDGRLCLLSSSREKGSYREAIALLNGFQGTCGISFKTEYLVDFCRKHKAVKEIELILSDPEHAAIFRSVGSEGEVCVLMPVRDIESYGRKGEGDAVEWSPGELPDSQAAPKHVDCYDILRYSAEEELEEAAIMA